MRDQTRSTLSFVVGQWVRGEGFYGRRELIAEILDGRGDRLWLHGTRRMGKTSLLRQLEHLTASGDRGFFPLYWDFQGAEGPEELQLELRDALLDAEDRLRAIGLEADRGQAGDLFADLEALRLALRSRGLRLLLLGDEAEQLFGAREAAPDFLPRLGHAFAAPGLRTVLASSRPLPSPWREAFAPALTLPPLTRDEARSLIRQDRLPAGSRPAFTEPTVEEIRRRCGNHPHLIQHLAKRALELEDLSAAVEEVAADPMARHFFCRDFEALPAAERRALRAVAAGEPAADDAVDRLARLGYLRCDRSGDWQVANVFFRRWLSEVRLSEVPDATALARPAPAAGGRSPETLLPEVYDELRRRARRFLARERPDHTLEATAVVHEAYLRLVDQTRVDWRGRTHFLAVGAQAMRRLLIDHARGHRRSKRGGSVHRVSLDESAWDVAGPSLDFDELLSVDGALEDLRRVSERQAQIVELRFYAGLKVREIAEHLGLSRRTVQSEWAQARSWLAHRLSGVGAAGRED